VSDKGDYSARVDVEGEDELGRLARTFNHMLGEIEQSVRMRDDFLSIASHELKTPLTPLHLHIQAMQRLAHQGGEGFSPSKLSHKIDDIRRQVQRLEKLINSLLDISRITGRRLQMERETLDLVEVVQEVSGRFSEELRRTGCELQLRLSGPVVGHWDRLRVDQIVTNLLTNAMKFGAGHPIEVTVKSGADGKASLVVRDFGIGIAPADQARIFERFERAVPTRHYGGFGLGLWIVRQIVEALDGTVQVESEIGKGSTFTVVLPMQRPNERTAETPVTTH
jgi:signal transduction histidine kinase